MLDAQDHVISTSRGNIFAFFGTECVTPDLRQCGIAGTRRQLLIETVLPQLNHVVAEQPITLAALRQADAVLISNTVRGVVAISRIEGQALSRERLTRAYSRCTDATGGLVGRPLIALIGALSLAGAMGAYRAVRELAAAA